VQSTKNLEANFVESFTLVKDNDASIEYREGDVIMDAVKYVGADGFLAQGSARLESEFILPNGRADQISQYTPGYDSQDQFNTSKFVSANQELTLMEYVSGYYFVIKKNSSGWRNWYLVFARNESSCSTAMRPRCTSVTVWKVQ